MEHPDRPKAPRLTVADVSGVRGGMITRTGLRAGRVNETVTNLSRSQSDAQKTTARNLST